MVLSKKMFKILLTIIMSAAFMVGCANVKMANIPSTAQPQDEITKLDADLNAAIGQNVDVLASDEFNKSADYLEKAKNQTQKGKPQSDVLDSLRAGQGALQEANAKAQKRGVKAEGLLAARQMALQAGAGSFTELSADLKTIDGKVSDRAENFSNTKADTLADYQNQYIDLERRSVILSQLGKNQAMINGTKKDHAKKWALISFRKAELSLKTAESIISTNVRNPEGYRAAVAQSTADTNLLMNVMTMIQQNDNKLSEAAAIKMVDQQKAIVGLEKNITDVNAQNKADQAAMLSANDKLTATANLKNQELKKANNKVQIQRAIEMARTQFNTNEAEAYQQGDNLVIRLKKINFATGKSDLPANALPLLAKVLDVAKSLNKAQVMVEGHTDSRGSVAQNQTLSESRANAVATYFKSNGFENSQVESEGHGYNQPIAPNKSAAGRAQNRRVDVIFTPSTL